MGLSFNWPIIIVLTSGITPIILVSIFVIIKRQDKD
jgi:hypothetical protein